MKRFKWEISILLSIVLWAGACSSTKQKEDTDTENVPVADAVTDPVPQPPLDTPPPATPPENTSVSQAPVARDMGTGTYTVQTGDTLMKIALETLGDLYKWKEIYEANKDKIKDPNVIPTGIVLTYNKPSSAVGVERNGEKYLIKKGDTLGTISNEVYGTKTKWKDLWENNKQLIHDPNRIFAGFYLYYMINGSNKTQAETPASVSAPAAAPATEQKVPSLVLTPSVVPSSIPDMPNDGSIAPPSQ